MSTLSAQFHVQGTSIGRDVYETVFNRMGDRSVLITRVGILAAVIIAVILGYTLPGSIIAQGTALFFGLCAAAFLSAYVCALFWKRATKLGVIAGMVMGTFTSLFWLLFVYKKTAASLGIFKAISGQSLLITTQPWPLVDPLVIGVPVAMFFTVLVSLLTKPPSKEHLNKCFEGI
jgi:SSS family solute:Na+ symporter